MFKKLISAFIAFMMLSFNTVIAEEYKIEHLPDYNRTNSSIVKITADSAVILPNNVLEIAFSTKFNSKKAKKGDIVDFVLPNGLHTVEGRFLLPSGTKILGNIIGIEKPKMFNRSARVYIGFDKIVLPTGEVLEIVAYPDDEDKALKVPKWKSVGKVGLYTIGFFGVGSGMAAWIGAASHSAGKALLIFGMPIGAGVGLILGLVTPGLHYKAKAGKKIYIKLDDCMVVSLNEVPKETINQNEDENEFIEIQ